MSQWPSPEYFLLLLVSGSGHVQDRTWKDELTLVEVEKVIDEHGWASVVMFSVRYSLHRFIEYVCACCHSAVV